MARKTIVYFIIAILFIFSVFSITIFLTSFRPDEISSLNINNNQVRLVESEDEITLLTYNIGYGGLGSQWEASSDKNQVKENLDAMVEKIDDINPDIFLLQEIDTNAKRSFYMDQVSFFNEKYPNYSYIYAKNKDISWLPLPITRPTGKVQTGLATFSKFNTLESIRYSLPSSGNFLSNLFEYKWAITKTVFETDVFGDLVILNVKLSPYHEGDFIREEQLQFLKELLEEEYDNGNYVIVGGNYSHNLPGADPESFRYNEEWPAWLKNIPDDYQISNFHWQIDKDIPTFRSLADTYDRGRTFVAVTDGFLVSDNIDVEGIETLDDDFENSNHHPVSIRFRLRP